MTALAATKPRSRFTMPGKIAWRSLFTGKWHVWFILSAGGILALVGAEQALGFFKESWAMTVADPVFGFPFRDSILLIGIVEVIVAMFCLFGNGRVWIAGLIAWVVADVMAYRTGLWCMGWPHPYPCLFYLINALYISPAKADGLLMIACGCLLGGSVAILLDSWRIRNASEFMKISCSQCGGHIKFSIKNFGQKIPCPHCQTAIVLQTSGTLKMSCVLCGGHIAFPTHAIGQKIPCPHCAKTITLLNPA
jgi:ribosomal protein S27E